MKSRRSSNRLLGLSLLALLLSAPQLATAWHSSPGSASALSAAPQTEDSHRLFREGFKKAQTLNAAAEMQRLVKKNTPEAVAWIMETAEGLIVNPDDEKADRMIALREAWRAAIDSDFAENMEKFFGLMDPVELRERQKLKKRYDDANRKYWANVEKKQSQVYGLLSLELEGLAGAFTTIGDHYFASQAWLLRSNCWEEGTRGEQADLYKVCISCKNATESLKKIDLRDRAYIAAKARYDYLAGQGYDRAEGEAGGEAGGKAGPPAGGVVATGALTTAALAFELIEDPDDFERPSYYLDELHGMWPAVRLKAKGSKEKIVSLGDFSPTVMRDGSAMVTIDADGDGKGEISVPLTGNLEPVSFKIGAGEEQREWGVMARIGTQSDMFQGVQMNMAPSDSQLSLYLIPSSSVMGTLGESPVRIFDDNMDGIYGSYPLSWEHDGLTKGRLHPELDSVVIGKSKRAVPFSEYMQIGDKWFILEMAKGGTELNASEVTPETGAVKLSFKGGKPSWIILRGSGKYENSYFDITDNAELPVGKYTLFYGELRKGKKQQMVKTLILPGDSTEKYEVVAGKTITVKLGGPFSFDFSFQEDQTTLTLEGQSVVVVGAAGERYERAWGCVPRPEVSWRKQGTKKGSKGVKTHVISENDQVTQYGWKAAWMPLDLLIEKKGKVEDSEVQLFEKKNKLFGKITSDWKE